MSSKTGKDIVDLVYIQGVLNVLLFLSHERFLQLKTGQHLLVMSTVTVANLLLNRVTYDIMRNLNTLKNTRMPIYSFTE